MNPVQLITFINILVIISADQSSVARKVIHADYGAPFATRINNTIEYIVEYHGNNEAYPALVTVKGYDTTMEMPLLIVAQQQKQITSWQIPYVVNPVKHAMEYNEVSHTLCPSLMNRIKKSSFQILSRSQLTDAECSNPVITIKTSSPEDLHFEVLVDVRKDFFINSKLEYNTTVSPSKPVYYYYNFRDEHNAATESGAVLVSATSDSNTCMMMSIQNSSCPVFDLENNVQFDSYWQTMNKKAGMVVTKRNYPDGFYIVMVVTQTDTSCTSEVELTRQATNREKHVTFKVRPTITMKEHYTIAASTAGVFGAIFVICTIIGIVYLIRSIQKDEQERSVDDVDAAEGMINAHQSNRWRQLFTKSTRSKSSSNYVWHVGIVALFYTLPVLQLVFTYQGILHVTGNEDICYYNFLCAHPLGFITDFNHVFSNIGYVFLGILFIIITYTKELLERSVQNEAYGLPKPYGMFYALGFALIMEGVMSACYHICPKSSNFQFDTSFMYVMTVLMIVNVYENRHSTGDRRGYAVFGILAVATTLSVIGIYVGTKLYFWIIFTIIQVTFCAALTWILDKKLFKMIFNKDERKKMTRVHVCRIVLWVIGHVINWLVAAYGIYQRSGFGSHLLMVLIVNALFYTIYYIFMKICHNEKILIITWVFIVLSSAVWAASLYFFVSSVTSWEVSPAQSRMLNQECRLVKYYDNHDIWHFLSSVALFFTFIVLLTLDEGITDMPRADIQDFHGH